MSDDDILAKSHGAADQRVELHDAARGSPRWADGARFFAASGVGEDDRHITSIDEDSVALAAIKALDALARLRDLATKAALARKDVADWEFASRDGPRCRLAYVRRTRCFVARMQS